MHDLRVSLQLVASCAQLLEDAVGQNQPALEYVQTLQQSAAEMQRMLCNEMERLRPEAGAMRWTASDLVARTWEIFTRYRLEAERRDVALSFHANVARLTTALDEEKFSRILSNLLSNALQYTPKGGQVRMEVRALGDRAEIDVEDDGCGVAPERIEKIFQRYETQSGYGYGLYIARQYAQRMGGNLAVQSMPGKGCTFTLRLPVRSVAAARLDRESAF